MTPDLEAELETLYLGAKSLKLLSDWTELNWDHFDGEGNGNPLQYSCLENPMGRGAW